MSIFRGRLRNARGLTWVIVAALVALIGREHPNGIGQVFLIATLLLLPGASVASILKIQLESVAARVLLTVSFGATVVMVGGYVFSSVGPWFGIDRPLDPIPQYWFWGIVLVALTSLCWFLDRDPIDYVFDGIEPYHVYYSAIFLLFPLMSAIGAFRLNGTGTNDIAVITLAVVMIVLLLTSVIAWRQDVRFPISALIYTTSLAVLWAYSLRGELLNGWDIQQEYGVAIETLTRGRWIVPPDHSAYAAMLSLTDLPVQLHSLTGMAINWIFRAVFPALLALVPVGMFHSVRRVSSDGAATATTSLLVLGSIAFPQEMVTLARQSLAFMILISIVVILSENIGIRQQRLYFMTMGVSLAFTHYSTAYLQCAVLFVAWLSTFIATGFKRANRVETVITIGPVVCTIIAALAWNLLITDNNALVKPSNRIVSSGLALSASNGIHKVPATQYQTEVYKALQYAEVPLQNLTSGLRYKLKDTSVPNLKGLAPWTTRPWVDLTILRSDLVNFALLFSVPYLLYLWKREPDRYSTEEDFFALGMGALVSALLFRFSGTLSQFYNPERGALGSNLYFAVPLTIGIMRFIRWRPRLSAWIVSSLTVVAIFEVFGLARFVTGGQPPSSLVKSSEASERFFISDAEYYSAAWIRDHIAPGELVQADRYGSLAMLDAPGNYHTINSIAPNVADWRAYIYESKVNLLNHRARGDADNARHRATFIFPQDFFNANYKVVLSTEYSRVYH